jgi:hypothetical protein
MSAFLMRGALIEYGSDLMGPIPNVVIFQFNPETLTRTVQVPQRAAGSARETTQAGDASIERITLTARFSAADELGADKQLARLFGVGTRLAALEKMVHPSSELTSAIGAALGFAAAGGGDARQSIPRQKYPRILLIWGTYRVLPVILESMSITEQQYDFQLNPVQADVTIAMAVQAGDRCADDDVATGALKYSTMAKEAQAMANLANSAEQAIELIPF